MDAVYIVTYWVYVVLRVYGLATHVRTLSELSFDVLACAPIIFLPRLASTLLPTDIVMLGLQSMLSDFLRFCALACLSSSGFYFAFRTLSDRIHEPIHIIYLMIRIFLGSSYIGFEEAEWVRALLTMSG
jgi:hypothetical protein